MAYRVYESLNVIFDISGPFGKLLTSERKTIIQACLREGGEWFRVERIPMRFTDWVYRLGYRVTDEWKREKRRVLKAGRALPFIGITPGGGGGSGSLIAQKMGIDFHNPEKLAVAMQRGCRTDITGTSKGGDIIIRTPFGHPILPVMAAVFTDTTPDERQQVARRVAAAFEEFLAYAQPRGGRSKKLTIAGASDGFTPRGHAGAQIKPRDTGTVSHRRSA